MRVDETLDAKPIEGTGVDGDGHRGRDHAAADGRPRGTEDEGGGGHDGGYPWALSH
ncbi:hypothetical protein [Halorubrum saccharovorum]|uniref:hypothetical protein n=1 Tax=Halorubrum saccharovorum TaxID=2248 RepID=UPI001F340DAC|nr:hypothetical protein [Halorubrum saccharovorum]